MTDRIHQPVLLKQSINGLNIRPNKIYFDCTLGSGGHAVKIIKKGGKLYGLDVDPQAIERTKEHLKKACPGAFFHLRQANFSKLEKVAKELSLTSVAGVLIDLGLSSEQLADKSRGFSFNLDAPLDMRADPSLKITAADLVNGLHKGELNDLFKKYGQEQYSLAIASSIVRARQQKPIKQTLELAKIVAKVKHQRGKIHPATKVFQALRMAVNDEINNLKKVLLQATKLLEPSGRLVVISFHSLEDRQVKNFIKENNDLKNLTLKPIIPEEKEILKNPRSRSAKLRIAEKI